MKHSSISRVISCWKSGTPLPLTHSWVRASRFWTERRTLVATAPTRLTALGARVCTNTRQPAPLTHPLTHPPTHSPYCNRCTRVHEYQLTNQPFPNNITADYWNNLNSCVSDIHKLNSIDDFPPIISFNTNAPNIRTITSTSDANSALTLTKPWHMPFGPRHESYYPTTARAR